MSNFDYTPEAEQYSPEIEEYIVEDRSPLADQYQVEILYRCNSHEVFVETLEEYFSKHSYGQSSLTVFPQETGFYITKVADGPRQCCAKYNRRMKDNNDELRRTNYSLQREVSKMSRIFACCFSMGRIKKLTHCSSSTTRPLSGPPRRRLQSPITRSPVPRSSRSLRNPKRSSQPPRPM